MSFIFSSIAVSVLQVTNNDFIFRLQSDQCYSVQFDYSAKLIDYATNSLQL